LNAHLLRVAIGSAIGAVSVVAGCGGNCKPPSTFTPTPYTVTFLVCGTSAGDAGSFDAGGQCFATCEEACFTLQPSTLEGTGTCDSNDGSVPSGVVMAQCHTEWMCIGGRKLEGASAPVIDSDDPLGVYFARLAWLEAASVGAFRRLARELRAHGAPDELVAAAKASARDEIRHARIMARLATKHRAKVPRVEARDGGVRDLESIARENAVEGCVGETFGAALAFFHGEHADADADVAGAMRAIAEDELRHAALGWAVAAWADARLSEDARARVRTARSVAVVELVDGARDVREKDLARALQRELWAA
jgi:hypothetical protein